MVRQQRPNPRFKEPMSRVGRGGFHGSNRSRPGQDECRHDECAAPSRLPVQDSSLITIPGRGHAVYPIQPRISHGRFILACVFPQREVHFAGTTTDSCRVGRVFKAHRFAAKVGGTRRASTHPAFFADSNRCSPNRISRESYAVGALNSKTASLPKPAAYSVSPDSLKEMAWMCIGALS